MESFLQQVLSTFPGTDLELEYSGQFVPHETQGGDKLTNYKHIIMTKIGAKRKHRWWPKIILTEKPGNEGPPQRFSTVLYS